MTDMLIFLLQVLLAATPPAGSNPFADALVPLVTADTEFSKLSVETSTRQAFLTYLTDEAMLFLPRPVSGRAHYSSQRERPEELSWEPNLAEISRSGDFGYTSGNWRYRPRRTDATFTGQGHYVAIWRKLPEGDWRVVCDMGVVHPKPDSVVGVEGLVAMEPPTPSADLPNGWRAVTGPTLEDLDRSFSADVEREGPEAAFLAHAAANVQVYRIGHLPAAGRDSTSAALFATTGAPRWTPSFGDVSSAGDLGYTWGYALKAAGDPSPETPDSSSYVHIWRRTPQGGWEIAADLLFPIQSGAR